MKRLLFLLFALFTIVFSYSQNSNTIAKLKYEDAEEAFNTGRFEETIKKLQEAEGLLNATNPKIMYLKIIAQFGMIQKALTHYSQLEETRKSVQFYMSKYGDIEGNEDKFKEVYKISEKLKEYPVNIDEFKEINIAAAFMEYQYMDDVKLGWTVDQVRALPQYKKHTLIKQDMISKKDLMAPSFLVRNNIIYGYCCNKSLYTSMAEAEKFVADLTTLFRFKPVITFPMPGQAKHVWAKNNKTITLTTYENINVRMYSILIIDNNIK